MAESNELADLVDVPGVEGTDGAARDVAVQGSDVVHDAATDTVDDGEHDGDADVTPDELEPSFRVVEVVSVVFDLPSPGPIVQLREVESPYRYFGFPIGLPEAQSIAMALADEVPPRPGTHELFAAALVAVGADVVALRLTGTSHGQVLGELHISSPRGAAVLDCRPSDGIALALRQGVHAPILCEESLLED